MFQNNLSQLSVLLKDRFKNHAIQFKFFSNNFERAKLLNERAERKSQYDALQEQLDTTSAALESNVQGLRRSAAQEAERYYKIDNDLISKEAILERTRDKEKSDAYIKSLEGSLKTQEDRNRFFCGTGILCGHLKYWESFVRFWLSFIGFWLVLDFTIFG